MSITKLAILLLQIRGVEAAPKDIADSFDKSQYRETFEEKLRKEISAPIIVQGRVREVHEVGRPKTSSGDARVKTQNTRIRIDVELTVRGNVNASQLEFSYFTFSHLSLTSLGVPSYIPDVGQRRFFFLKYENGLYRSIGDVTDYTLRVSSGLHPSAYCRAKEPGCCLAEILLTPMPMKFDRKQFVIDLTQSSYIAQILCPRLQRELLERLAGDTDEAIANLAGDLADEVKNRR
jgi:hypothetical protein